MLHLKCVACRLRLAAQTTPENDAAELCPGCGSRLEPVGSLAEVVGFQAVDPGARAERGAVRWLDAEGRFSPEAVAAALASLGVTPGRLL